MICWKFPNTGGGESHGFADPQLEYFRGNNVDFLAREVLQNSIDAQSASNSPVTVKFKRYELATNLIPDLERFKQIVKACKTHESAHHICDLTAPQI
jgi:hypothetical protein